MSTGEERSAPPLGMLESVDDFDAINQFYREKGLTDGLPIVPPTRARVNAMVAGAGRPRATLISQLAPAFGLATVESIAINAVMAGCDPIFMPVLIAAVEAVSAPEFNLQAVQATTNPVAVWIIINGPIARELGVNHHMNCLGEGNWANATIGRAMRLIQRNIGGALPGDMDRTEQGQPGRYSFCCAENEDANPWEPLHVERGFRREQSTVTVVGAEGTMNMNTHAEGAALLRAIAGTMVHPPSNEYMFGGEPWLILGPEHASKLARAGYSKEDVKAQLWEMSKMPAGRLSPIDIERTRKMRTTELGVSIVTETMLPISPSPKQMGLIVAGGAGTHSTYVPSFGVMRAVTRAIATGFEKKI